MNRQTIVTLNSVPDVGSGGLESRESEELERRVLKARHAEIMRRLEEGTRKVGSTDVMITVPDRDVSRMQSELARQAAIQRDGLPSSALEAKFGTGLLGGDWWGWLKSTLDWIDREDAHEIVRAVNATPIDIVPALGATVRVAMMGDWGTGLYGAPKIVDEIRKRGPFDMLLHLGDVYYSGTTEEVQERLIDLWPIEAARISRTLNGNHEMYSGGYGYFDLALKTLSQPSSYFAYQTPNWILIALDTAYVDHDMDRTQVGWLNTVISHAGHRKVVLFSHQQLFSRLDQQGPKLHAALSALLSAKIIRAWYWGHEHECVLYDRHPVYGLTARCLGNGGIPEPRKGLVRDALTEKTIGAVSWKRLPKTDLSPSCIVLDGPNPFIDGEAERFGPHGFMTLDFEGSTISERTFLADGTLLHEETIA